MSKIIGFAVFLFIVFVLIFVIKWPEEIRAPVRKWAPKLVVPALLAVLLTAGILVLSSHINFKLF